MRLVARAPALAPDTRLLAWLFTVARNLYWSYCRSRLLDEERLAALARQRRAPKLSAFLGSAFAERVLEPALVDGVAVLYLTDVLRRALALYGF